LTYIAVTYMFLKHMSSKVFDREVKKGSAEMLILALLEDRPRHGYEICRLIETRSGGAISFQVASLYPMLYRLEKRALIAGRWVEKAGERRRRFYKLTAEGKEVLKRQRSFWAEFVEALDKVARIKEA
jgi:PadR family transcriptional regulator PadR